MKKAPLMTSLRGDVYNDHLPLEVKEGAIYVQGVDKPILSPLTCGFATKWRVRMSVAVTAKSERMYQKWAGVTTFWSRFYNSKDGANNARTRFILSVMDGDPHLPNDGPFARDQVIAQEVTYEPTSVLEVGLEGGEECCCLLVAGVMELYNTRTFLRITPFGNGEQKPWMVNASPYVTQGCMVFIKEIGVWTPAYWVGFDHLVYVAWDGGMNFSWKTIKETRRRKSAGVGWEEEGSMTGTPCETWSHE